LECGGGFLLGMMGVRLGDVHVHDDDDGGGGDGVGVGSAHSSGEQGHLYRPRLASECQLFLYWDHFESGFVLYQALNWSF
jgi:hypothetical protein